jgi:hypothetical protein
MIQSHHINMTSHWYSEIIMEFPFSFPVACSMCQRQITVPSYANMKFSKFLFLHHVTELLHLTAMVCFSF